MRFEEPLESLRVAKESLEEEPLRLEEPQESLDRACSIKHSFMYFARVYDSYYCPCFVEKKFLQIILSNKC